MYAEEQANLDGKLQVRDGAKAAGKGSMIIEGNASGDVIGTGGRKSG